MQGRVPHRERDAVQQRLRVVLYGYAILARSRDIVAVLAVVYVGVALLMTMAIVVIVMACEGWRNDAVAVGTAATTEPRAGQRARVQVRHGSRTG